MMALESIFFYFYLACMSFGFLIFIANIPNSKFYCLLGLFIFFFGVFAVDMSINTDFNSSFIFFRSLLFVFSLVLIVSGVIYLESFLKNIKPKKLI